MSPKKRKIYIAVIIVCFLATGAILYFGLKSPTQTPPLDLKLDTNNGSNSPVNISPLSPSSDAGSQNFGVGDSVTFSSPVVFPRDNKFDWTLTQSDEFKSLAPIPDLVLDPSQVGKANPFSP